MTKAIVTRCPYCGAVWRLPDRDTAERGPVRCSECRHSFDATCNLLAVPEDRFPGMPAAPVFTQPSPEISAPIQNSDLRPDPSAIQTSDTASKEDLGVASVSVSPLPEKENNLSETSAESNFVTDCSQKNNVTAAPTIEPRDSQSEIGSQSKATADQKPIESEQLQRLHAMTPGHELEASRPNPSLSRIIPAKSKPMADRARKIRVAETFTDPVRMPKQRQGGAFASVFTAFILLLILAATLAVIFNQKIINAFPQTKPLFHQVCGKIPCPGFYLSDISAFVVSKTNLRAVDESGNYQLEITLINGSDIPQAIPALDIELVDDADTTLMHKTLMPAEYLSNPPPASIAADRSITVRFSMQTNVTPARCIVTPVYPK